MPIGIYALFGNYGLPVLLSLILCSVLAAGLLAFGLLRLSRRNAARRAVLAAQEAQRNRDELLAVLSHELRDPLAPALNALELLRLLPDGEPILEQARGILERQIRQLAQIVDDLIDMFDVRHGKINLHKRPTDLAELVRRAAEDRRGALKAAALDLVLELPEEPVSIPADDKRLTQVMTKLVQNAAKFTAANGRITVHVTADHTLARAVVKVRDTGVGMTAETRARLFEMFSQAEQSLARRPGGLGLGLALVKGFVELHGGQVSASSPGLGAGTEITFWLPLADSTPAHRTQVAVKSDDKSVPSPVRVLIIEDNVDTARTLQVLLDRLGHQVRVAHDGHSGVAAARAWAADVILCDLGLPGMDGYEVAATLRADPVVENARRLIAVSGYGDENCRQRSKQAGFDLHLTKPLDPLQLQHLLMNLDTTVPQATVARSASDRHVSCSRR